MKKLFYLSVIFSLWLVACIDPPSYPIEPEIELVEMIGDTVSSNIRDTVSVVLSFTDGDGDLGYNKEVIDDNINPDCINTCDSVCYDTKYTSIIAIDSRTNCSMTGFHLPFIPKKGSSDAITGLITINVFQQFCFNEDQTEPRFTGIDSFKIHIRLKDRAGNYSNEIITPTIFIKCEP